MGLVHVLATVAHQTGPCMQLVAGDAPAHYFATSGLLALVPPKVLLDGDRYAPHRLRPHPEHTRMNTTEASIIFCRCIRLPSRATDSR